MKQLPSLALASSLFALAVPFSAQSGVLDNMVPPGAAPAAEAATVAAGKIGCPAPKLDGLEYVKGTFDGNFKQGTVYVVEFWATWCPPCRQSIPHLSALQKKHGDKVVMIGISSEKADPVKKFLADPKLDMEYIVAVAGQSKVSDLYMKAFNQKGIPCAFIVDKQGKIAWVGHPMQMEKELEAALQK